MDSSIKKLLRYAFIKSNADDTDFQTRINRIFKILW